MTTYPFGAVLKIQRQDSMDDIKAQMRSMKATGLNFVVVWPAVYWWEDRAHRDYPFNTGHQILTYADEIGMKIIMELAGQLTSLEYAPDFVMKDDYYCIKADGTIDRQGMAYGYLNYNHPEMKDLIEKQYTDIVRSYKDYPALYGYDIWNETMFTSYDIHTLRRFRTWLKAKYKTIEALNEIWDHTYYDWSQIHFTHWLWASVMPMVDYEQFHKDNVGMILKEWSQIVKAVDRKHPVIADNIHSMITADGDYHRPHDDWNAAANVDEYGISFYPKNNPFMPEWTRWQMLTGVHSAAKQGRFWISELQTHHQTMFNPFSYVHSYDLKWWTWEAISHGAKGIVYWKWNPFITGVQTFGRGLVDHRGGPTPRSDETASLSLIIRANEKEFMAYEPEQPNTVILYDRLNHDFVKAYTEYYQSYLSTSLYTDSIAGLYKGLWEQNIPVKFVTPDDVKRHSIGQYRTLFMTNQVNISDELAEGLKTYLIEGGTIICDGKFGEIQDHGQLHETVPGAGLWQTLGFRLLDMEPDNLAFSLDWNGTKLNSEGFYERRDIDLTADDVRVLASYADGRPAMIEKMVGKGRILYISTFLWYDYFKNQRTETSDLIRLMDNEYGLRLHDVSHHEIKVCSLHGENGRIVFAFNYGQESAEAQIGFPCEDGTEYEAVDLYSDDVTVLQSNNGRIRVHVDVEARGVTVVKLRKRSKTGE